MSIVKVRVDQDDYLFALAGYDAILSGDIPSPWEEGSEPSLSKEKEALLSNAYLCNDNRVYLRIEDYDLKSFLIIEGYAYAFFILTDLLQQNGEYIKKLRKWRSDDAEVAVSKSLQENPEMHGLSDKSI